IAGVAAAVAVAAVAWLRQPASKPADASAYEQVTFFAGSATSPSLSADGRMLTFIQGQSPFFGAGQVYVKAMPNGEPVQLTRDDLRKMAPALSPDGARVTYTVVEPPSRWNTWSVPTAGGEPRLWMGNAAALTWISSKRVMFSQILEGIHMRVVAGEEGS